MFILLHASLNCFTPATQHLQPPLGLFLGLFSNARLTSFCSQIMVSLRFGIHEMIHASSVTVACK